VGLDTAIERVLERLSDGQVEALASACAGGGAPGGALTSVVAGAPPASHAAVNALDVAWTATPGLTGAGVALALRVGLRARKNAEASRSRPVWTGPGAAGEQRLTAAVLHELVASATERVLLVSYAAFTLSALATDLSEAVVRGCCVDVVFETEHDSGGSYTAHGTPFARVAGITRWRWPAEQRDTGALLHAKVLVIDGHRALIGSANLTQRALTANLEAGVLLGDPQVAGAIEAHVRGLMAAGTLEQT